MLYFFNKTVCSFFVGVRLAFSDFVVHALAPPSTLCPGFRALAD
jgi:hypothetical protein